MSGVNLDGRQIRKGAADAIEAYVEQLGGDVPAEVAQRRRRRSPRRAARRWSWPTARRCWA